MNLILEDEGKAEVMISNGWVFQQSHHPSAMSSLMPNINLHFESGDEALSRTWLPCRRAHVPGCFASKVLKEQFEKIPTLSEQP